MFWSIHFFCSIFLIIYFILFYFNLQFVALFRITFSYFCLFYIISFIIPFILVITFIFSSLYSLLFFLIFSYPLLFSLINLNIIIEEFAANVYWALHHDPTPLSSGLRYTLSWEAATERWVHENIAWKYHFYRNESWCNDSNNNNYIMTGIVIYKW